MVDNSQVEGGYLAADVFPFALGLMIDAARGAYYAHQQSAVVAHLDCQGTVASETSSKVTGESLPGTSSIKNATKQR